MSEKFFIYHYGFWFWRCFSMVPTLIDYPVRDPQGNSLSTFSRYPPIPVSCARTSLLDVVADDTKRLMAKVGTRDRQRLDQHLTHINDIERRLKVGRGTCRFRLQRRATSPERPERGQAGRSGRHPGCRAALRSHAGLLRAVRAVGRLMRMNAAGEVDGPGALEVHESTHFQGADDTHFNVTVAATRTT